MSLFAEQARVLKPGVEWRSKKDRFGYLPQPCQEGARQHESSILTFSTRTFRAPNLDPFGRRIRGANLNYTRFGGAGAAILGVQKWRSNFGCSWDLPGVT